MAKQHRPLPLGQVPVDIPAATPVDQPKQAVRQDSHAAIGVRFTQQQYLQHAVERPVAAPPSINRIAAIAPRFRS